MVFTLIIFFLHIWSCNCTNLFVLCLDLKIVKAFFAYHKVLFMRAVAFMEFSLQLLH